MEIQPLKGVHKNMNLIKPSNLHGMKGFTLLEMAMVLAIIGLVMGAAITATTTLLNSSHITTTQSKENNIKTALINYISTNGRLPCPADPTPAQLLGANAGTEAITAGICNVTPVGLVVTGVVPWVQLGLTQEAATDAYYNFFTYQVTLSATKTVPVTSVIANVQRTISGLRGDISLFSSTPINPATSLTALGNQLNYCTPVAFGGAVNPCAAVAIIVSYGQDGLGAYRTNGQSTPPGPDELENANKDSNFVKHDFAVNTANPFDDIILPLTVSDLLSPLSTNGSLPTYNALLNANIANITAAITNYAMTHKSGSPGNVTFSFPPTLSALNLPPSVTNDPWGTPFNYVLNVTTLNLGSFSPNTVIFTLLSSGPDTVQGTADDLPVPAISVTENQFQMAIPYIYW